MNLCSLKLHLINTGIISIILYGIILTPTEINITYMMSMRHHRSRKIVYLMKFCLVETKRTQVHLTGSDRGLCLLPFPKVPWEWQERDICNNNYKTKNRMWSADKNSTEFLDVRVWVGKKPQGKGLPRESTANMGPF